MNYFTEKTLNTNPINKHSTCLYKKLVLIVKFLNFAVERNQDFAMLSATQKGQATTINGRLRMRQLNYDPEYPSIRFEIFEGVIKTPHVPKYNFPMVV